MDPDDYIEDHDDIPHYPEPSGISAFELSRALGTLQLFEDPYLRVQATNLAIIDHFIMTLERSAMLKRFDEEMEDPLDTAFISAQTQMWLFAAYELLRTWREWVKDVVRWSEDGGLEMKARALEKELSFLHPGRKTRAAQLRRVIADPSLVDAIKGDIHRTHILFTQLEHVRVAIAKHEVSGKPKQVAYAPGFGTFHRWNGSLEYELGFEGAVMGMFNRRDVGEAMRALTDTTISIPGDDGPGLLQ